MVRRPLIRSLAGRSERELLHDCLANELLLPFFGQAMSSCSSRPGKIWENSDASNERFFVLSETAPSEAVAAPRFGMGVALRRFKQSWESGWAESGPWITPIRT